MSFEYLSPPQPALTNSWFSIRPSGSITSPTVRRYLSCFHGHVLAKGELGGELLGTLPERLPFLRTINALEPDLFGFPRRAKTEKASMATD